MKPIRIVLADDHALVRAGIRLILEKIKGVEVVGEARDGHEVLEMVAKHRPDILVTDIAMPFLNGIEAAARISKEFPYIRVLILSMHSTEEHVYQAMRAGISGYLLKESAPSELELAIQALADGKTYLSPPVSQRVVADYRDRLRENESPLSVLTSRQREILQMIAEGRSSKEIAQSLHISVKTVLNHRAQIMERLHIHDTPGLVRFAIRHGLVTAEK
jgi:DNA-binding NarL/FixJ family response regulator